MSIGRGGNAKNKENCQEILKIFQDILVFCTLAQNNSRNIHSSKQGSLYYQPKQCTIIREIPQNYHIFALFDTPGIGNLMTPAKHSSDIGKEHSKQLLFPPFFTQPTP